MDANEPKAADGRNHIGPRTVPVRSTPLARHVWRTREYPLPSTRREPGRFAVRARPDARRL